LCIAGKDWNLPVKNADKCYGSLCNEHLQVKSYHRQLTVSTDEVASRLADTMLLASMAADWMIIHSAVMALVSGGWSLSLSFPVLAESVHTFLSTITYINGPFSRGVQ
jgi:hypothetical protein